MYGIIKTQSINSMYMTSLQIISFCYAQQSNFCLAFCYLNWYGLLYGIYGTSFGEITDKLRGQCFNICEKKVVILINYWADFRPFTENTLDTIHYHWYLQIMKYLLLVVSPLPFGPLYNPLHLPGGPLVKTLTAEATKEGTKDKIGPGHQTFYRILDSKL